MSNFCMRELLDFGNVNVRMYVCMNVCVYMYVYITHIRMYVCILYVYIMHVYMYVLCKYVCMYVCN